MMLMTAVARRIVLCKPPADAQLTISLIADAEVDGRFFVEEVAVGIGCCSLMGCDFDEADNESVEQSWV